MAEDPLTPTPPDRGDVTQSTAPGHQSAVPEPLVFRPLLICIQGTQCGGRYPLVKAETVIGRSSVCDVVLDDDLASRRHVTVRYLNFGHDGFPPVCELADLGSRNGTEVNGQLLTSPRHLKERDRIVIGSTVFGFFLRDKGEMRVESSLYDLATRDALTGLDNRHQFNRMLAHHIERAWRYSRPMSLLVIDADLFKTVNDNHGHDVGDLVLRHIAQLIHGCCRSSEVVARWGGEEFAVLMPESDGLAAKAVGERIRQTVAENPLETPKGTVGITVSIGGCELARGDTEESFFHRADQQLIQAKQAGRNRMLFAEKATGRFRAVRQESSRTEERQL